MRTVRMTHVFLGCLAIATVWPAVLPADDVMAVAGQLAERHMTYVYGSSDLDRGGLDCSGFVQLVFRQACGIDLPDEADKQLAWCREHGQVWDANSNWSPPILQPGDLIFYAGPEALPRESLVSHVMIYCGNGIAVGAQGTGRQLDGSLAGVGYYPFRVRAPRGVIGEPGTRFLGHRQVFAYGRLLLPPGTTANPLLVSIPAALLPGSMTGQAGLSPRPALSNPDFD
jgi:hypothetical protein